MADIEIEIDGKTLTAKPNSMVIQVADEAGIYIPRFCYHKHLSIAANCRMCLVEVEKAPKPLPACATPVMPGMKVFTKSPKAIAAQKAVMEFLLINHPLDCPICDQGGECELQDLSLGYGSAESYYAEGKRSVKDQDIGPLIATEMTRCIQCTRCVRFGTEVAGLRELGATGRGEHMEIGTYIEQSMRSEVSGNIIDLCPVGALTSKPFRFTARAWELNQYPSIAPHDCLGSNVNVHTRNGTVMRVVPRENIAINETWMSDRDRFSYEGLYHTDRLDKPMIRERNGAWKTTDWQTALEYAVKGLQAVLAQHGGNQVGALASPNATLEELYLLQKMLRQLDVPHIDHRLREVDFRDQDQMPLFPGLNTTLADIEQADVVVLIGSNIQKEQPLAGLRVRKAVRQGAQVVAINMVDYDFHFDVADKKIVAPHALTSALADIVREMGQEAQSQSLIKTLRQGKKVAVLLGIQAFHHPDAAEIRFLAQQLAAQCQTTVSYLTEGANAAGAWLAGALPHRKTGGEPVKQVGLDAQAMCRDPRKAYVLLNLEPDFDSANAVRVGDALKQAEFVVSLSLFQNALLAETAHVILPIAPYTETSGTLVNAMGEWQTFKGVATAFGESRPGWKVLRVMANLFNCDGFDYTSTKEIHDEIKNVIAHAVTSLPKVASGSPRPAKSAEPAVTDSFSRVGEIPIYAGDGLVRRAKSLQKAQSVVEGAFAALHLHPRDAKTCEIQEGDIVTVEQQGRAELPVVMDERIPLGAVWIAGGIEATKTLGDLFGRVKIVK